MLLIIGFHNYIKKKYNKTGQGIVHYKPLSDSNSREKDFNWACFDNKYEQLLSFLR